MKLTKTEIQFCIPLYKKKQQSIPSTDMAIFPYSRHYEFIHLRTQCPATAGVVKLELKLYLETF